MLLGEMKIGKPLEIFIHRDGYDYRVVSKIEDVEKGRICITLIASERRVFQFLDTDVVELVYRTENRMWKWTNVKSSVIQLESEMFHCFMSNENGVSYNRRNAYRVNIDEKIKLKHKIKDQDQSANEDGSFEVIICDALLRDLSEVGVGFYSNGLLGLESQIEFEYRSFTGAIQCEAVVVRFFESRHGDYRYYYGCRLTKSSQTLTKYIYEKQRQELKKIQDSVK